MLSSFEKFATNIPFYGYSIICIDNKNLSKLSKKIKTRKIISYAFKNKKADVRIIKIKQIDYKTIFVSAKIKQC